MESSDARILRGAAIPTLAAGLAAIAVGLFVDGAQGALGAFIGLLVVLVFFGASIVAVSWSARNAPQSLMPIALGSYVLKIFALLGVMAVLRGASWMNGRVFGLTVLACTAVWLVFEVRTFLRTKMLYVEPSSTPGPGR